MLKTRVITALVLLVVLLGVLFSNSLPLFLAVSVVFFAAAAWESFRLFRHPYPLLSALLWAGAFIFFSLQGSASGVPVLLGLCVAIWLFRLIPSLALGLPPLEGWGNRFLGSLYTVSLLGCFSAVVMLFLRSPLFLVSVMAIVWIADIGAYFFGKAFGKHKLAPSISPGKSWEGALGGLFAVLLLMAISSLFPSLDDTFASELLEKLGWTGFVILMTLLVAVSVAGDLFESQLKRRAGIKDSSNLLPGHGGVLDRIDALIPTLPLAALVVLWI